MKNFTAFFSNKTLLYPLIFSFIFLGNCSPKLATETSTSGTDVGSSTMSTEKCISISANNMNVLYIGVDNPITIATPGTSPDKYEVSVVGGGGQITHLSDDQYKVTVMRPTAVGSFCEIKVSGAGFNETIPFRVKRIPDPIAMLNRNTGGTIGNGEFKAQAGIIAMLDNFDFEAKCQIQGFELTRVAKRQDAVSAINRGSRYNDKSKRLVMAAKPGDVYLYTNIKARCPGDVAGRKINTISFFIR